MSPPDGTGTSGAADAEAAELRRLVDGITTHAIFMVDPEGRIRTWPESAASLYGYEAEAVRSEPLDVLWTEDGEERLSAALADARDGPVELDSWHHRADGTVFWASLTLSPLRDETLDGFGVVSRDTTASKQHEQMLERQNDRLKEFTDILAHDLRNPLNVIDLQLEQLRETGDPDYIDSIEATTERMERLVDDLLRVARQGNVITDPERVEMRTVVETAWEATGELVEEASLRYRPVPPATGDADRLAELFENLFRNAIDHAGPAVTVTVGPLDDGVYVEDDGPGIPTDRLEAVFDHGVSTTESGSGYGLSIVRTIVNAHGWDVVATTADAGGARFEVTGIEFLE